MIIELPQFILPWAGNDTGNIFATIVTTATIKGKSSSRERSSIVKAHNLGKRACMNDKTGLGKASYYF